MPQDTSYEDIINKDILELMGAKDMPEDKKRNLYTKMLETIQNRVIARVADMIPDNEMAQWGQLVKAGEKAKAEEFLKARSIDIPKLMLQEALIYKTEMVNLAKTMQGQVKGAK